MTYSPGTWERGVTKPTAAMMNNIEQGIVAIDTCAGSVLSTPSRAWGTWYTNSGTKTLFVMVSVDVGTTTTYGCSLWLLTRNGSDVTIGYLGQANVTYSMSFCVMFAVPPGHDYRLSAVYYENLTLSSWVECPIF